jgi:hypothetical protein
MGENIEAKLTLRAALAADGSSELPNRRANRATCVPLAQLRDRPWRDGEASVGMADAVSLLAEGMDVVRKLLVPDLRAISYLTGNGKEPGRSACSFAA